MAQVTAGEEEVSFPFFGFLEDLGGGIVGGPAGQAGLLRMGWEWCDSGSRVPLQEPLDCAFCSCSVCVLLTGVNLTSFATDVFAEQRCQHKGIRLLPVLIGRCSRTQCGQKSISVLFPSHILFVLWRQLFKKQPPGRSSADIPYHPSSGGHKAFTEALLSHVRICSKFLPSAQHTGRTNINIHCGLLLFI